LPDLVDQPLSRVAELEVNGPELFRLRHIDRSLHQLAHRRLDLGSEFFQEGFDAFFPGLDGRGRAGTGRHA
jgi:hypothetical protein